MQSKILAALVLVGGVSSAATAQAGVVDDTSLAAPGVYFGVGNGGTNYGWTTDTEGPVELGLTTIHRGVDSVDPTSANIYNVPTGPDGAANRAWWNFDFSINLDVGGAGTLTLGDVTPTLTIYDYLHGTTATMNPLIAFGNDNSAFDGTNTRNGNDAGQEATPTDVGAQNSENLTFGQFAGLGFDMNLDDTFLITLSLLGPDDTNLGSVSEYTVVGEGAPTPLPAALPLFASGLGALGLAGWRSKQKAKAAA
jgi:hypothetical protein